MGLFGWGSRSDYEDAVCALMDLAAYDADGADDPTYVELNERAACTQQRLNPLQTQWLYWSTPERGWGDR